MRNSLIILSLHDILVEFSSRAEWNGQDILRSLEAPKIHILFQTPERKTELRRWCLMWKKGIRITIKEIRYDDVEWIYNAVEISNLRFFWGR